MSIQTTCGFDRDLNACDVRVATYLRAISALVSRRWLSGAIAFDTTMDGLSLTAK